MKFIKKFKLFESTELDEIISTINDILLEYIEDVLISHVKLRFTPYKLNVFWCS